MASTSPDRPTRRAALSRRAALVALTRRAALVVLARERPPRLTWTWVTLALAGLGPALPPAAAENGRWTRPVAGEVITPYRNGDDPYAAGQHRGIDMAAAVGEPVVAATGGKVTFAGTAGSSGLTVAVRTSDGRFDTSYLHLSSVDVRRGEEVAEGTRLGAVGTTGRRSTERPHLHFGVREAGQDHAYRDPLDFLPPPASPAVERDPPAAPAPVRVPAPAVPRPPFAPASRRSALRRRPARARRPLGRPGAHPRPLGVRVPGATLGGAPQARPELVGQAGPEAGPAREFAPEGSVAGDPEAQAAPGLRLGLAPAGSPASRGAGPPVGLDRQDEPRGSVRAGREDGVDVGWLLACAGLVLAAAALARPAGTRRVAGRGRTAVGALLKPLTGRS